MCGKYAKASPLALHFPSLVLSFSFVAKCFFRFPFHHHHHHHYVLQSRDTKQRILKIPNSNNQLKVNFQFYASNSMDIFFVPHETMHYPGDELFASSFFIIEICKIIRSVQNGN